MGAGDEVAEQLAGARLHVGDLLHHQVGVHHGSRINPLLVATCSRKDCRLCSTA